MSQITASMVKDLRERTGAGMMDCKKALGETNGDLEAAIDWLRAKGIAKAANKASRATAEGVVALAEEGTRKSSLVEVNSETDFVARNPDFQAMAGDIAQAVLHHGDNLEVLKAAPCGRSQIPVADRLAQLIATIGENMTVRRAALVEVPSGVVGSYIHGQVAPGLGKIGVLVALQSTGDEAVLAPLARQLAMHVAAINPVGLSLTDIPEEVLEREKAVLLEKNQGKPPHLLEKIVESGLKSFAKEHCLLEQMYVHDGSRSVQQVLKEAEGQAGAPISLTRFVRLQLGEGVEKAVDDFASEVAKVAGSV